MPKIQTVLTVFVSSPSDVTEERIWLEDIIQELNMTWSDKNNIRLDLIRWEKNAYPMKGTDVQETINKSIGNEYDIFIGIFWTRFGTPTNKADSGSEEEFNIALERSKKGEDVTIGIYFKESPVVPSKIDPAQIEKLQSFRKRVEDEKILYYRFDTKNEFETNLRFHLSKIIQEYENNKIKNKQETAVITVDSENEEDEGLLDYITNATSSFTELAGISSDLSSSTIQITEQLNECTQKITTMDTSNISNVSHVISVLTYHLSNYNKNIGQSIKKFNDLFTHGMENFEKAVAVTKRDYSSGVELSQTVSQCEDLLIMFSGLTGQVNGFIDSIQNIPSIQSDFNRTKKKTIEILTGLSRTIENGIGICKSINGILTE